MKLSLKTGLAALVLLLSISCKKENSIIQSSGITGESNSQALSTGMNESEIYASVKIGKVVVMKKNLNVNHYRNGDIIPQVKDNAAWAALTTGAWCWYNNDSANGAIYGKLYNWYAVNDPRGLAPAGWHIPSDEEATTIINSLGGEAVAGGKMKSTGTIEDGTGLWLAPNTGATNSSGFTGLPGGTRYDFGFYEIGDTGNWWTSTASNSERGWFRSLHSDAGSLFRKDYLKGTGWSVRCIKD